MPKGFGKHAINSMGRPLSTLTHLKRSIVEVKAEENCLAHALIIGIAKVNNDDNYKSYRQGRKVGYVVQTSLQKTGSDLTKSAGIPEPYRFQEHFRDVR